MRQKSGSPESTSERIVKNIHWATRKRHSPEEKILIVLDGPQGETSIAAQSWRRHYNIIRPHESLGYKPLAPAAFVPAFAAWPAALRRSASPATLQLAQ